MERERDRKKRKIEWNRDGERESERWREKESNKRKIEWNRDGERE